jgi:hypothetical protein
VTLLTTLPQADDITLKGCVYEVSHATTSIFGLLHGRESPASSFDTDVSHIDVSGTDADGGEFISVIVASSTNSCVYTDM